MVDGAGGGARVPLPVRLFNRLGDVTVTLGGVRFMFTPGAVLFDSDCIEFDNRLPRFAVGFAFGVGVAFAVATRFSASGVTANPNADGVDNVGATGAACV